MFLRPLIRLGAALMLVGCASYSGRGLQPGSATLAEVRAVMGEPARQWQNPDGSLQLAYPRGPSGYHTFMVHLGPDGRLRRIENVLDSLFFGRIQPGQDDEEVTRILGPSIPAWTTVTPARRERVREWRYCDDWNAASRFDVLFDTTTGKVRSTQAWREECHEGPCVCSR